ncbi:hypothetical protein LN042_06610 [Kitasatospora sp. RB6PN24]|uniref:D-alanyl-D-alanine carboxypeptidase family protein n=1 Tax=Kitasatospora humi TaxID=2893891 RepID=UPI001E570F06|nr:hypothetical protein [Kitasatospora humi]MCC9306780.1 hypothetical protein [Kitasatospora humi]
MGEAPEQVKDGEREEPAGGAQAVPPEPAAVSDGGLTVHLRVRDADSATTFLRVPVAESEPGSEEPAEPKAQAVDPRLAIRDGRPADGETEAVAADGAAAEPGTVAGAEAGEPVEEPAEEDAEPEEQVAPVGGKAPEEESEETSHEEPEGESKSASAQERAGEEADEADESSDNSGESAGEPEEESAGEPAAAVDEESEDESSEIASPSGDTTSTKAPLATPVTAGATKGAFGPAPDLAEEPPAAESDPRVTGERDADRTMVLASPAAKASKPGAKAAPEPAAEPEAKATGTRDADRTMVLASPAAKASKPAAKASKPAAEAAAEPTEPDAEPAEPEAKAAGKRDADRTMVLASPAAKAAKAAEPGAEPGTKEAGKPDTKPAKKAAAESGTESDPKATAEPDAEDAERTAVLASPVAPAAKRTVLSSPAPAKAAKPATEPAPATPAAAAPPTAQPQSQPAPAAQPQPAPAGVPRIPPVRRALRGAVLWGLVAMLVIGALVAAQLLRPLPAPKLQLSAPTSYTFTGDPVALPWPTKGQAAAEVVGLGPLGSSGPDHHPVPIASVTKVMTAYLVLKAHPLKPGESGPTITVDKAAAQEANDPDQSSAKVVEGQQISEYEALEMLMLPSANNIARLLARWDTSGSEQDFVKQMNQQAAAFGMTDTTYGDPAGYNFAVTKSTAKDQLKLGEQVMANEVFRGIVSEKRTIIAGDTIKNTNELIDPNTGVIGVKTGSSNPSLSCLMWAATKDVGGTQQLLLGVTLGQPPTATDDVIKAAQTVSAKIISAGQSAVTGKTLVKQGDQVGYVSDGLGGKVPLVAAKDLVVPGFTGVATTVAFQPSGSLGHSAAAGTQVGVLTAGSGPGQVQVPVTLQRDLAPPPILTRLTRLG